MGPAPLEGKVVLITGAGGVLGRAFALTLSKAGARIALTSRSHDHLSESLAAVHAQGGEACAIEADVGDAGSVHAMVQHFRREFGPIDILINNAGVGTPVGPSWVADPDEWWRNLETNLRGPFLCCREVIPQMIDRDHGCIINVASGAGTRAIANLSAYVTAKAALIRFTEVQAEELRPYGVAAFSIEPGTIRTGMVQELLDANETRTWLPWFPKIFDEGRDIGPEYAASLVRFLASGRADTLSGRYFTYPEDPEEVLARGEQVLRDDLYTLRLRKLF